MRRRVRSGFPPTPAWVKIAVGAALLVPSVLLIAEYRERHANQARLSAVASKIAGRSVEVRCPGPAGRVFGWDIYEGMVRFRADGTPHDETRIRHGSCRRLDDLAEGRAADALACIARTPDGWCGEAGRRLAFGVAVLAHESHHLRGELDEGLTECRALQDIAWTARALGAAPEQGRALAVHYLIHDHENSPDRYRANGCQQDGELDRTPGDGVWP